MIPPPTWRGGAVNRAQQRFALIFGLPVPGHSAPKEEGPTMEAAKRAMANLEGIVVAARERGEDGPPLITEIGDRLVADLAARKLTVPVAVPPPV